ncbi:MAG: hypothetical protein KAS49_04940 [Candidatus Cloacimonetes bacterium]|nr:hypothetical protein [Candidatus Cloacimonadota bacterium]
MKMIYCNCNVSILEELLDIFQELKIANYQVIEKSIGKDLSGEPRLDSPIWPGYSSQITTQIDEITTDKLMQLIKKFNASALNNNEIITLVSWKIEDYIY